MKPSFLFCLPLAAALAIAACGDSTKDTAAHGDAAGADAAAGAEAKTAAATESASSDAAGPRPYKVKSGIVESSIDMMGPQKQTTYFDDYGAKQAVVTDIDIMGQKSQTVTMTVDGWTYSYDATKKEGTKMKMPAGVGAVAGMPSADQLTDKMKEEYKYKEIETMTIAGKEAKGISMEAMGMPVKIWTWEGIPLRTEMSMGGKKPIVTEVKNLQVDVEVPADRFVVPADIKLTELGK